MARRQRNTEWQLQVNPAYDFTRPPGENPEGYWEPERAAAHLIRLSNEALDVTQQVAEVTRRKVRAEAARKVATRAVDLLERELLAGAPLTSAESKNTATTNAALLVRARTVGCEERLLALEEARVKAEAEATRLIEQVQLGQLWLKTIERMCENLKMALAFYKDEKRRGTQY